MRVSSEQIAFLGAGAGWSTGDLYFAHACTRKAFVEAVFLIQPPHGISFFLVSCSIVVSWRLTHVLSVEERYNRSLPVGFCFGSDPLSDFVQTLCVPGATKRDRSRFCPCVQ